MSPVKPPTSTYTAVTGRSAPPAPAPACRSGARCRPTSAVSSWLVDTSWSPTLSSWAGWWRCAAGSWIVDARRSNCLAPRVVRPQPDRSSPRVAALLAGEQLGELAVVPEQRLAPLRDQLLRVAVIGVEPAPVVLGEHPSGPHREER